MHQNEATWVLVTLPRTTLIGLFSTFWLRNEVTLQLQNSADIDFCIWTDLNDQNCQQVRFLSQKVTYYSDSHTRIWYVLHPAANQVDGGQIGGRSEQWHMNRFKTWGFRQFTDNDSLQPLLARKK